MALHTNHGQTGPKYHSAVRKMKKKPQEGMFPMFSDSSELKKKKFTFRCHIDPASPGEAVSAHGPDCRAMWLACGPAPRTGLCDFLPVILASQLPATWAGSILILASSRTF